MGVCVCGRACFVQRADIYAFFFIHTVWLCVIDIVYIYMYVCIYRTIEIHTPTKGAVQSFPLPGFQISWQRSFLAADVYCCGGFSLDRPLQPRVGLQGFALSLYGLSLGYFWGTSWHIRLACFQMASVFGSPSFCKALKLWDSRATLTFVILDHESHAQKQVPITTAPAIFWRCCLVFQLYC